MRLALLAPALLLLVGCVSSEVCTKTNGITDNDGKTLVHQATSVWGLHWVFGAGGPISGDGRLENAVNEFTAKAKADGHKETRISSSETTMYWWCFPPISFIVTPINSHVAGDVR